MGDKLIATPRLAPCEYMANSLKAWGEGQGNKERSRNRGTEEEPSLNKGGDRQDKGREKRGTNGAFSKLQIESWFQTLSRHPGCSPFYGIQRGLKPVELGLTSNVGTSWALVSRARRGGRMGEWGSGGVGDGEKARGRGGWGRERRAGGGWVRGGTDRGRDAGGRADESGGGALFLVL